MSPEKRSQQVSVIIPAMNEERVIGKCLEALSRLDYPRDAFEVIVIDNGSTDRTVEIARSFSSTLQLNVLSQPGSNISAMRNFGVSKARGDLLAFLDADCIAPRDWLNIAVNLLNRESVGVLGAHYKIPPNPSWIARIWFEGKELERQGDYGWVPAGDMFVPRSTFRRLGGFDESLKTNEDCEFCDRARAGGLQVLSDATVAVEHLGTPQTLAQFYRKERWHMTDGVFVFLRSLPRVTNPGPILYSSFTLGCLLGLVVGAILALATGSPRLFIWSVSALLLPAFGFALRRALKRRHLSHVPPLTVMYVAFGIARGEALIRTMSRAAQLAFRSSKGNGKSRKVLMLTQYLHMGGLERMIFSLSTALKAHGEWQPQIFVYDRMREAAPDNDLTSTFQSAGIPVVSFLKPSGFSIRAVLRIYRHLRSENVAVIHTHDLGALIYGVGAKMLDFGRARLIHTQHSFVHLSRRRIYRYYERIFVRFADEVTVVSPDLQRTYAAIGVPQQKIHVIPNGVSFPGRGTINRGERRQIRERLLSTLDVPAGARLTDHLSDFWLLYMARVHKTKGQDHALELWRELSPGAREKSVLLFVGPEGEPGRLKLFQDAMASAIDSSRILYLGTTHQPEAWLACADIMLSCSEYEGMPLGPIEAAGAGLPLVLSEIPGHEVVKEWSAQYPLSAPGQGAREVEAVLDRISRAPDVVFKAAWEKGDEIRSRYALDRMGGAYAALYATKKAAK